MFSVRFKVKDGRSNSLPRSAMAASAAARRASNASLASTMRGSLERASVGKAGSGSGKRVRIVDGRRTERAALGNWEGEAT